MSAFLQVGTPVVHSDGSKLGVIRDVVPFPRLYEVHWFGFACEDEDCSCTPVNSWHKAEDLDISQTVRQDVRRWRKR